MLKVNSKLIKKGDTFIALKGINEDGHKYINEAIKNGADTIICEYGNYSVETIIVPNTKVFLAEYLKSKINLDDVIIIGITGTNGKTTTAYLTYTLLNYLGLKTAYIGTIGLYIDEKIKDLDNTTPDLYSLYELFELAKKKSVSVIVMEVSSHSLEMDRVLGINFDIAAFTNLTRDHLDYHKTMENYKNSKLKLFDNLSNRKIAIINSDDNYYKNFLLEKNHNITYGIDGDYQLSDFKFNLDHTEFKINDKLIILNIPGKYNIYNYAIAFIICQKLGFEESEIIEKTKLLRSPVGRYDIVKYKDNNIVIDYAHTPDAVLNIINSTKDYDKNKVITIIGCGGNRDRTKRSMMGKIATENSDYVIFTNDNPRNDDEVTIINDIVSDIKKNNYEIIYNREKAIKKGIDLLKEKDILLILGKGHENYQIIKGIKYHFDDKEIVLKYINIP